MAVARICRLQLVSPTAPTTELVPAFTIYYYVIYVANNTKNKTKMCLLYICMSVCIYSVIFCLIFCIICKKSIPRFEKIWPFTCRCRPWRIRGEMRHGSLPTEDRERPPTLTSRPTLTDQMTGRLDQVYEAKKFPRLASSHHYKAIGI